MHLFFELLHQSDIHRSAEIEITGWPRERLMLLLRARPERLRWTRQEAGGILPATCSMYLTIM